MVRTMDYTLPDIIKLDSDDRDSKSSGVVLSSVTGRFDSQKQSPRLIDQLPETTANGSWDARNVHLPTISKSRTSTVEISTKQSMKCAYRVPASTTKFPSLPSVPPTVGRYRHRALVVPALDLPERPAPKPCSPAPTNNLLRCQYIRQRNDHLVADFSTEEIRKACEQYSIMRYLQSREGRYELSGSPVRGSEKVVKSLPSIAHTRPSNISGKSGKIHWVPRLKAWIPEQKRFIQYIQLSSGANVTKVSHPVCSHYHDFFHKNLNLDAIHCNPCPCTRFAQHHQRKHSKQKYIQTTNVKPKKQKPLTVPRDPFKSHQDRLIKRPWLNSPKPIEKEPELPPVPPREVTLVLPDENEARNKYHWMLDNATMTEDSFSDIYSVSISVPMTSRPSTPFTIESTQSAFPVRRTNVLKVDKACDVMSLTPGSSRPQSVTTEASTQNDVQDEETSNISVISPQIEQTTQENQVEVIAPLSEEHSTSRHLIENPDPIPVVQFIPGDDPEIQDTTSDIKQSLIAEVELSDVEVSVVDMDDEISIDMSGSTADSYVAIVVSDSGESKDTSIRAASPAVKKLPGKRKARPPPPRLLPPVVVPTVHQDTGEDTESMPETTKHNIPTPIPAPLLKGRKSSCGSSHSNRSAITLHTPSPTPSQLSANRRGQIKRDRQLAEDERRARKAEERRKKAIERFEKMKQKQIIPSPPTTKTPLDEIDSEFLAQFCIINPMKVEHYQRAFNNVDTDGDGQLTLEQAFDAAKRSVPSGALGESDVQYINRILELMNSRVTSVDFRMFAIIVSLAQKIINLDDFMRGIISRFDFKSLDTKMWRARELFRQFADDPEGQTMSMDALWTELKAGGVSQGHEQQVRNSMKKLKHLDLLDFITYLPLFAITHGRIVSNPLCSERIF